MAEQVCSDEADPANDEGVPANAVLGLLASLIDKSLVVLDGEAAGNTRYRLLDTIREYAAERLAAAGEEGALSLRHRDCILTLVEERAAAMFDRGELPWPVRREMFRRGIAEYGNFRIALKTSLAQGDPETGLRLCVGLRSMWVPHGDAREAATWLDRFLVLSPGQSSSRMLGRALALRAEIAFDLQDYNKLERCARESLELSRASGDNAPVPVALRVMGQAAMRKGQFDDAVANVDEARAAAKSASNYWELGLALIAKAAIAVRQDELTSAQQTYEEALTVLADNHRWGGAQVQYGMGTLARVRHDDGMAVQHYRRAMEIFRELDAWPEIARCQAGIGWAAIASSDFGLAHKSLAEGLQLSRACGHRFGIARGLEAFAALAAAQQQPERAARLAGAARQLRESLGHPAGMIPGIGEVLEQAGDRLGISAAAALFAEGREMTVEDAANYALGNIQEKPTSELPNDKEPAWTELTRPDTAGSHQDIGGVHKAADPLTRREHQIALLIVQGMSNREIANKLIISPTTAARHVANILAKLGLSSRTQVISWARKSPAYDLSPADTSIK
jgi:DNA-binding CsgD family transcriptional regulator/Tfp pilus assembly protein PilF